ncbi:DUF6415 family natural product biosynthesis protein [Streptomyces olivaceus]|uniref:DUF6415 family natural product biosynthesis protein n=1 Tax=Streptomyces olivaceus TaxID=47716 RepID=UPI001CCDE819|nr:DUF6415 family natural product biosynthesis protein [Streptomyces olivaceus]
MANATTPAVPEAGRSPAAPDTATVRTMARRLLAAGAAPPPRDELAAMTAVLRENIARLIPTVEALAETLPEDDAPRACALACLGEARMRLRLGDGDTDALRLSVAVRMARTAGALADHHQTLRRTP